MPSSESLSSGLDLRRSVSCGFPRPPQVRTVYLCRTFYSEPWRGEELEMVGQHGKIAWHLSVALRLSVTLPLLTPRSAGGNALKHLKSVKPTSSRQLSQLTVAPRECRSCIFDVGYQLADPDSFEPMR